MIKIDELYHIRAYGTEDDTHNMGIEFAVYHNCSRDMVFNGHLFKISYKGLVLWRSVSNNLPCDINYDNQNSIKIIGDDTYEC